MNPIRSPGRPHKIFPVFEFEAHGGMDKLRALEAELLAFLKLPAPSIHSYQTLADHYGVVELSDQEESKMAEDFSNSISLEHFPLAIDPFWNMKQGAEGLFNKIDVILYGMETIGSAERETDPDKMRQQFMTISNGEYAGLLFKQFGEKRVMQELEDYLGIPMFERFGAGIGLTRMIRALRMVNVLDPDASKLAVA